MAALAAKAVKDQRRKAALKLTDHVNEQKQILNNIKRNSLTSVSTLGSNFNPEVFI